MPLNRKEIYKNSKELYAVIATQIFKSENIIIAWSDNNEQVQFDILFSLNVQRLGYLQGGAATARFPLFISIMRIGCFFLEVKSPRLLVGDKYIKEKWFVQGPESYDLADLFNGVKKELWGLLDYDAYQ